jgi:cytochrome b subunit of formate dehydrogenase
MVLAAAAVLLLLGGGPSWAGSDEACLACHADQSTGAPQMPAAKFRLSVHHQLGCGACHAGKDEYPHDPEAPRVSCASCHQKNAAAARDSDHGRLLLKGRPGAALCAACHGSAHELLAADDPASLTNRLNIPRTCSQCHEKFDFKGKFGLEPFSTYARTVHGKALFLDKNPAAAVCVDCHGSHDLNFARDSRSRAYKFNIPKTCGRCHAEPLAKYSRSIHGRRIAAGIKEAPVCTDCHGEHNITAHQEPDSTVYAGSIVKTCSSCHGSERIIAKFGMALDPARTYLDSYHGVAFVAGNLASANCASCHGFHEVLPSSDPRSTVNPKNLQRTCGACHRRAGDLVRLGKVHMTFSSKARDIRETILRSVRRLYLWLIALVIGGMFLHNILYHQRKLLLGNQGQHDPYGLRMSRNERWQHFVLIIAFAGLAYTGFSHTYPEAPWARFFFKGASGAAWRALLHRAFAVIFMTLGLYHVYWISSARDGRRTFRALYLSWRDVLDFFQMQRYNLLHSGAQPKFVRFNYIEKSEYWALLWGSPIMVATGCIVWFTELSLRFMSKWFIDLCLLVHFMEAVLACLAIVVWHLYWTILDPEVYPMNWAWIVGRIRLRKPPVK